MELKVFLPVYTILWVIGNKKFIYLNVILMNFFAVNTQESFLDALHQSRRGLTHIQLTGDIDFSDKPGKNQIIVGDKCKGLVIKGPGTIRGAQLRFEKVRHRIILKNMRIRVGAKNLGKGDALDALYADRCKYVSFVNCTFSDASDEILSFDRCSKVRIHRCIVGDPLHIPTVNDEDREFVHKDGKKGSHGFGIRCGSTRSLKITETLIANCSKRNPQLNNKNMKKKKYKTVLRDCLIFNYGEHCLKYNSKLDQEVKKGKFVVNIKNNTFLPGPRTKKAIEVEIEDVKKIGFKLRNLDTNKIQFYPKFNVLYDGKKFKVKNGEGLRIPINKFLDIGGCQPADKQDINLKTQIRTTLQQDEHQHDGFDNKPELWPLSGWKHFTLF